MTSPGVAFPTTEDLLNAWSPLIGSVPHRSLGLSCEHCLGPLKIGFSCCYSCKVLFEDGGVPWDLHYCTVPMSTVINPSPWYTALATYKGLQRGHSSVLLSVAHHFIRTHWDDMADRLGGEPSLVTVVPSKHGISYDDQQLRRALSHSPRLAEILGHALTFRPGQEFGRKKYTPEIFAEGSVSVRGKRVILIEDLWVTGATAISAAGALRRLGAAEVLLLPIARKFEASYWGEEHPYVRAASRPYTAWKDRDAWPR